MHVEAELLTRCARGEERAYRELVGRIEKPLVNFIYRYVGERHLAEDIFQETFVRVLRTLPEFRPEASVATWIFTIARNLCLDHAKAKKRHREVPIDADASGNGGRVLHFREMLHSPAPSPDAGAEKSEMERRVIEALALLTPAKREALVMRLYADLPYQEIAKVVDAPVGTVKFRVHEALNELSRILTGAERNEATGT
ncbi:MAG: sigma-70 family RNA polymerase sigma factor [Planctomycetes bacterium]|nr:sigma-70 family RNA polymerase sigma factor [Planctomycetota bacterium]